MKSLVIIVVLIFISTGFVLSESVQGSETRATQLGYILHDPIRINSDTELHTSGFPGSGTVDDPYVISGYDIDARGKGAAIYIGNTTDYILIENCMIWGAIYNYPIYGDGSGIILYSTSNIQLRNLLITSNHVNGIKTITSGYLEFTNITVVSGNKGIYLYNTWHSHLYKMNTSSNPDTGVLIEESENITLEYSYVKTADMGITLSESYNNSIVNNTISNTSMAIAISGGTRNLIGNNTVKEQKDGDGIVLEESPHNIIVNNNLTDGGIYLEEDFDTYTTQVIENNTINGRPVYYYKNKDMHHSPVPADGIEVILGNVSNVRIDGLNLSNGCAGIMGDYVKNVEITNSQFSENMHYSVYLMNGENASVVNNRVKNGGGIQAYRSSNITIEDNDLIDGYFYGIQLYRASHIRVANNTIKNFTYGGLGLTYVDNGTIENNTVSFNSNKGIEIFQTQYVRICYNHIRNSTQGGMMLQGSKYNELAHNTFSGNYYGLVLDKINGVYSEYNEIAYNLFVNNTRYGILISSGSYNEIYNNSFYYNYGTNDTYNSSLHQAADYGTHNYWNNSAYGNYWHDWANNNDTNDQNPQDGIVDWPYVLDGSAGAKDYYPLKEEEIPIPELSWAFLVVLLGAMVVIARKRR